MEYRALTLTLAAAGGSVALTIAVADSWLMYAWWAVAPGLAVLAVIMGIRRHAPTPRYPWWTLLAAVSLMWVGWTMSAWIGAGVLPVGPDGLVALVRDVIYVLAYPMLGFASLLVVRARTGGRDRDNVIDAAIVMVALATTLGAMLFGSGGVPVATGVDRLWVTISPLLMAAVVTASIRLLMANALRSPAAWLLFASSSVTLIGNLWTAQLLQHGQPTQVTAIDALWILGFALLGAAVLHPSMRELTTPLPASALVSGMPTDRMVMLGTALLSAPIAHLRMSGDANSAETMQVVAGGVLVAVLAVWRVARLLSERDQARDALADSAARDVVIATVAQWALEERSTWELLGDVDRALEELLPGIVTTVIPTRMDADGITRPVSTLEGPQVLLVPVDDGDSTIAHVTAGFAADHRMSDAEEGFLTAVASVLSAAARQRAEEDRLRHDALHDGLTGLPNRTLVIDRLDHQLGRRDTDVCVMFLDLDGFKAVNDRLGHDAGDMILRRVAVRLREAVREADTVGRLAGDEFVVIISQAGSAVLDVLIHRILEAAALAPDEDPTLRVTASIGVASAPSGTIDPDTLLQRADEAMYRAKRSGRRVVTWNDEVRGGTVDGASDPGPARPAPATA